MFHALTGSADVEQWWGPLIGPGKPLDTTRHAIVAANLLGSCYGSTGPQEWAADNSDPFPDLAPADLASAHAALVEHLGVTRLALVTGGSLGGMVALEWGRRSPVPVDRLVVFAAPGRHLGPGDRLEYGAADGDRGRSRMARRPLSARSKGRPAGSPQPGRSR